MHRNATGKDWPDIYPIFAETVAAGETYTYHARHGLVGLPIMHRPLVPSNRPA